MNKKYESFRNGVMYIIRSSGLDIGVIFYILKDLLREVEEIYSNTLQHEIEEEERQRQEAEEAKKADEAKNADEPEFEDVPVEADNDTEL